MPKTFNDFSEQQQDSINLTVIIVGSLSIFGCLFILLSYLLFMYKVNISGQQILRRLSTKQVSEAPLIVSMTISNLIQHVNQMFGSFRSYHEHRASWMEHEELTCKIQAFIEQLFPLATSLWAFCIGITFYRLVVKKKSSVHLFKYFHLLCWGFPLALSVGGMGGDMYGAAGNWCWIKSKNNQLLMQYVEMVFIFGLICAIYVRVLMYVRRHRGVGDSKMRARQKNAVMRIAWFPMAFLIAWSGGLINRLHAYITNEESFALTMLMSITIPSMGWLNAIAYAATNDHIQRMYGTLYRRACWGRAWRTHAGGSSPLDMHLLPPNMEAALNMAGETRRESFEAVTSSASADMIYDTKDYGLLGTGLASPSSETNLRDETHSGMGDIDTRDLARLMREDDKSWSHHHHHHHPTNAAVVPDNITMPRATDCVTDNGPVIDADTKEEAAALAAEDSTKEPPQISASRVASLPRFSYN